MLPPESESHEGKDLWCGFSVAVLNTPGEPDQLGLARDHNSGALPAGRPLRPCLTQNPRHRHLQAGGGSSTTSVTPERVGVCRRGAHRLSGPCRDGHVCRCAHTPGGTGMIRPVTAIHIACSAPWEGRPGPSASSYAGLEQPCLPASQRRRPVLSGPRDPAIPQPPEALRRKSLLSAGVSGNRPPAQVRARLKACLSFPKRAPP